MIKRSELKVIWKDNNINNARKFIIANSAINLYPFRKINSIYYDNSQNQMYHDSIEGIVPRKKIRVRSYHKLYSGIYFLEKKFTYEHHREKDTKKIDFNKKKYDLINDTYYGNCFIKIVVSFYREYFFINNSRITIDYNIEAYSLENPDLRVPIDKIIIEFKSFIFEENNNLVNNIGFQTSRFSKYTEAIEKFNYIQ